MNIFSYDKICDYDLNLTDIVCNPQNEWSIRRHSWSYLAHARPNNGLIYIVSGSVAYSEQNGRIVSAEKGDILYLPKGARYFADFVPNVSRSLLLNFELSCGGAEGLLSETITCVTHDRKGIFYDNFEELCDLYARTNDKLTVKSKLYELLSRLSRYGALSEERSGVRGVVAYIDTHLNKELSISDLARLCAMSESTFRRAFCASVGESPKKYINRRRLEKAQYMLRSELSIGEICAALGYYDSAYFSKLFKQHTGLTPAAYRDSFLQPQNR